MDPLNGSVVLVTGAGRGVGRAIAVGFAERGAGVAVQEISPVNLDETLELVRSVGSEGVDLIGDMSKKMQVQSMIEEARDALGEIDILINHASVAPAMDLLSIDEWDWDRTLGINLKGYFLTIQSIGRLMASRHHGLIVNVMIPPTRYIPTGAYPAYEVSKAGVRELTRQAGQELSPQGVHVFGVEAVRRAEETHSTGDDAGETLTWWQREPFLFASAVLDLCGQAGQIDPGVVLSVDWDGSVHPTDSTQG